MVAVLMAACVVWLQGMSLLQATSIDIASMLPYGIDDVAALVLLPLYANVQW